MRSTCWACQIRDCPETSYLRAAVRGYDAPTGLGTPSEVGAF